jgi:hypothetical protein
MNKLRELWVILFVLFLFANVVVVISNISLTQLSYGQTGNNTNSHHSLSPNMLNSTNNTKALAKAREQYLSAWNQTDFQSAFDTFIIPGSSEGYGLYDQHRPDNVFRPGETMVLYIEPVGFTHRKVTDENGKTLYEIKLIPSVTIFSQATNQSQTLNIAPFDLRSHNKNTEFDLTITVRQETPFPSGNYKLAYDVTDAFSGKSFEIIKNVKVTNVSMR